MAAEVESLPESNSLRAAVPTLPSRSYTDPDHHRRELEVLWYRNWLYLCRADSLAEPLDFRTFAVGDQEILLLRDEAGALRAFHNTCRHRGSALCLAGSGRLRSARLVCPYHRWTYALDGRLIGTSSLSRPEGFETADYPLYEVALETWRGFVFANLGGAEGPPLEASFDREALRLDAWPLDALVVGHRWSKVMACNWKVFWENFNECLHCPGIHPELCELVPIYGRGLMTGRDDPQWAAHAGSDEPKLKGGLRRGAETWSADGLAQGPGFEVLGAAERAAGMTYIASLPSMFAVGHVDHVRAVRLRPLGPEATELSVEWLFTPETLAAPGFDLGKIVDFAVLVMEQDAAACEMNQRGLRALRHEQGVLMPEEYAVKGFHDWVRAALARP